MVMMIMMIMEMIHDGEVDGDFEEEGEEVVRCRSSMPTSSWLPHGQRVILYVDDRSGSGGACAVECEGKKESSERSEEICQ
eukprot:411891-Hanusia_phi.AAC.1